MVVAYWSTRGRANKPGTAVMNYLQPAHQEPVFFHDNGAYVSRSRIAMNGVNYAVNTVQTVSTSVRRKNSKPLRLGLMCTGFGLLLAYTGLAISLALLFILVGGICIALYVWVLQDRHALVVNGRELLCSTNSRYVGAVEGAIYNALASRS
jgi:hypothetical protein